MGTQTNLMARSGVSVSEADFEGFYRAELPRIYNFFRYRVGGSQAAEDLTSETFEKAWRYRERYRHDLAAFSTWLFTIARRVAQDHYRKHRNEIPLDEVPELSTNEIMEDLAQRDADFVHLSVLLAQLEDRERELVALKYGAGLTNRDLARLSGLSESNVGVILHRTLQTLRSKWEAYYER
jgi:RNA polymerase sigma-70 factor (ECF subfamily)